MVGWILLDHPAATGLNAWGEGDFISEKKSACYPLPTFRSGGTSAMRPLERSIGNVMVPKVRRRAVRQSIFAKEYGTNSGWLVWP